MIEVGEYIKTKQGKLDKVINNNYYMARYIECERGLTEKSNILKHSKNIIDLLDIYDYANGNPIITIHYKEQYIETLYINELGEKGIKVLRDFEIKTILTKEQYEQNCYRLED